MHRPSRHFWRTDIGFHFKCFRVTNLHLSVSCFRCLSSMLKYGVPLKKIGANLSKMGCGKWAGLVAASFLFHLLATIALPGEFLSLDCGGKTNHTEHNRTWVTDNQFIEVGQITGTHNGTFPSYLQNLRFFPKPLNKSCYHLPVKTDMRYLLRLWFAAGNYSAYTQTIRYSIETLSLLTVRNRTINNTHPVFRDETIVVSSGSVLYICLIRTSKRYDPFISAIELRVLQDGMYRWAQPGTMMSLQLRCDVGGKSLVSYPQDVFGRLWEPNNVAIRERYISGGYPVVNSNKSISANKTPDLPPSIVMQTALVTLANRNTIVLTLRRSKSLAQKSLLLLYFADILPVHRTETINFDLTINGKIFSNSVTILQNYSAIEVPIPLPNTNTSYSLELQQAPHSALRLIINAFEYFLIVDTDQLTYPQDIKALDAIKSMFDIKEWISDPCHVIDWDGISCDKSGSSMRISEINLSRRNLTGSIPQSIAQLTALVNVSLENNHLIGQLPNLSNLTMLERLHLQNNNLTGTIPDWLSEFKNLTELFIDNNNFSGVIPPQLYYMPSLNLRYSGNPLLRIPSKPNKDKLRLILGITISGTLVIVLGLIVIITVDRKKYKKKASRLEKESKHVVDQGKSMVIVPNTTKSRAFTLEEMTLATQNFSHKIGQGGFGSVFFGRLEQGEDIAVKVLSFVSKQGVQEFLNEVELFSRVHHKNLVSLLGYCIESRELMLVYEHMSGGSLKDRLYGPIAEHSQLNWKTRLQIASDAAQGLEYLHIGCTPKIIHRDIKTANILLDRNFNGKLADFGLSRMTIEGEASYVITSVKGTLGYLDPAYFSTHMLTEKSDVYSFGVVLLEIICGRRPINVKLPGDQLNLIRWVTPYVEMDENPAKMEEIIDKRLGRNYNINSIIGVAKLAIRCVQPEPSSRPSVDEVVEKLKEAIKLEKDKDSLISEIDIEYEDLGASSACFSVESSGPKEVDSAESSSKISKQRRSYVHEIHTNTNIDN